jgi:putative addiction module killer protein
MIEVRQTEAFASWLAGLRDHAGRFRIVARLRRLSLGNLGDVKAVGGGLSELRVDHGPGYRVYLVRNGERSVVLLLGGDKSTQRRDIVRARSLARGLRGGS